MSRLLSVVAGVVALVGFAGFMAQLAPVWLTFPLFMVAMGFVMVRRVLPEMVLGPADPVLPPPAPALAEATARGTVGTQPTRLVVSVHPDRVMVGHPLYGRRTIMADQLTGLGWEPDGALRIDHVAGTLRSAPVRLHLPPGSPFITAIEAFATRRPVLAAPTPAPGRWTFIRVWALAAGAVGVSVGVLLTVRGEGSVGVPLVATAMCATATVSYLASGRAVRR